MDRPWFRLRHVLRARARRPRRHARPGGRRGTTGPRPPRARRHHRPGSVDAAGERTGRPGLRGAGVALRRRSPWRRPALCPTVRPSAPRATASSSSPARSRARCTSWSRTRAICARRTRSSPTWRCVVATPSTRVRSSVRPAARPARTRRRSTSVSGAATSTSTRCSSSRHPISHGSSTSRPSATWPRADRRLVGGGGARDPPGSRGGAAESVCGRRTVRRAQPATRGRSGASERGCGAASMPHGP